jgi:hypothetical protein
MRDSAPRGIAAPFNHVLALMRRIRRLIPSRQRPIFAARGPKRYSLPECYQEIRNGWRGPTIPEFVSSRFV